MKPLKITIYFFHHKASFIFYFEMNNISKIPLRIYIMYVLYFSNQQQGHLYCALCVISSIVQGGYTI